MIEREFVFPQDSQAGERFKREGGLGIRDYVAIQALCGLCSDTQTLPSDVDVPLAMALAAYKMADAMLKVRELKPDQLQGAINGIKTEG